MTQIFVGNLAHSTTEDEVRRTFERYGHVSAVRMIQDRDSGRPRGFAFVAMPRFDDAEEAINQLNGFNLAGRSITVNESQSKDSPQSTDRRTAAMSWLGQL